MTIDRIYTELMPGSHSHIAIGFAGGFASDPAGRSGLAHLMEHVLLAPANSSHTWYLESIEGLGGVIEAQTRAEHIRVRMSVPTPHFAQAVDLLVGHISQHSRRTSELNHQRQVIESEIWYKLDGGRVALWPWGTQRFLYDDWPHSHDGWLNMSPEIVPGDWDSYYPRFFDPSNAVVGIVGGDERGILNAQQICQQWMAADVAHTELPQSSPGSARAISLLANPDFKLAKLIFFDLGGSIERQLEISSIGDELVRRLRAQDLGVSGQWGLFDETLGEAKISRYVLSQSTPAPMDVARIIQTIDSIRRGGDRRNSRALRVYNRGAHGYSRSLDLVLARLSGANLSDIDRMVHQIIDASRVTEFLNSGLIARIGPL
jgi:hypothetical protein